MKRLLFLVFCLAVSSAWGQGLSIYSDELDNGFQDWGWAVHNYANTSPANTIHSGNDSVSVTISTPNYDGLQIVRPDMDSSPYTNLTFWINGGSSGGQQLQVYGLLDTNGTQNTGQPPIPLASLTASTWQFISIPLSSLGVKNHTNFTGIVIQSRIGAVQPTFYLDDIQLQMLPPPSVIHVGLDAAQVLRPADARWFGINTAVWDDDFDVPATANLLSQMGTQIMRFPGGSLADEYFWEKDMSGTNTFQWVTSFSHFAHIATNIHAQAMITVNYGTGTSNEAAAWVLSANVTNHLGFKNWEIGNECYGPWETDSNGAPQDPYTYAVRAANYMTLMRQADPTIKIGVVVTPGDNAYSNSHTATNPVVNPRTSQTVFGWTPIMLATLKSLGAKPDFVIHHVYPETSGDSDATLLQDASNWAVDAATLRQEISDYYGPTGTNIELICTENNADPGNQGKQSTSIVDGLYLADSLSQLMKTEFNGFIWWDLRNGADTSGDFSSALYGWRTVGDLGIMEGTTTLFPTYYSFKLMQYLARPGDTVLNATSDYNLISAYATRKADGALALLVINKDGSDTLNCQIALTNFSLTPAACVVRSYGIAQDEATRTNAPLVNQDIALTNFPAASTNFMAAIPPYSMVLYTFAPASPQMLAGGMFNGSYVFQVQGQSNAVYQIQTSTNLLTWSSNATITLLGTTGSVTNTVSSGTKFWRAMWVP